MPVIPDTMTLAVVPQAIPAELRELPAWAVWRHETDERGHESKPPYQPNEERAYASDPATWSSFSEALGAYYDRRGYWEGISFAIHEMNGIVGVDLDHIEHNLRAATEIAQYLDSYTEISPSGEGLRVFVRGVLPTPGRRIRDWIEMYSDKRFLTVTGHRVMSFPPVIAENQNGLDYVHGLFVQQGQRYG